MATVLILGATSDIGIAIARQWASQNFDVILAGRNPQQLKPIESDICVRYGVKCNSLLFDAVDFRSHMLFFTALPSKPDVSICVFGIMENEEQAFSDWQLTERMINTNYTGAVSILNVIAKYYISQKKGTIIGISSVSGNRGRATKLIYASSKAAFTAYLSGLRNKCFSQGVHVMTVQPGYVYTKMTENLNLPETLTSGPGRLHTLSLMRILKKRMLCI